jgi:hypothetical protein
MNGFAPGQRVHGRYSSETTFAHATRNWTKNKTHASRDDEGFQTRRLEANPAFLTIGYIQASEGNVLGNKTVH